MCVGIVEVCAARHVWPIEYVYVIVEDVNRTALSAPITLIDSRHRIFNSLALVAK